MSGYGLSTASNLILGRITFAGIIVKKAKQRQQTTIIHKYWRPTLVLIRNSPLPERFTLVLIARFRAGLAELNLGYPENPAPKPRKPS